MDSDTPSTLLATWPLLVAKGFDPERLWRQIIRHDQLGDYLAAAVTLCIGYLVARSASAALARLGSRTTPTHGIVVARKVVFYAAIIITLIVALNQMGIKLSGLLAAAGIATVAISFAAQTSVSNVISGVFLLFDRPFSIGDTIKVDTTLGAVVSLGLLSSKVRTFDNLVVRIPNETLLKSTIINYSLLSVRRVDIGINVAHEADIVQVHEVLCDLLHEHTMVLDEPAPVVLTDSLSEISVRIIARVWVDRADYVKANSDLNTAVVQALNAHRIPRPRPERVVTLRDERRADDKTPLTP